MYDVIVVGAGIGGASAAYFLGTQGLKVLVLERQSLPRYKPCAGGVPRTVYRYFPFDFGPVIEREIEGVGYSFGGEKGLIFPLPERSITMVMRDKFDHFVLNQAPAEVREGATVRAVHEEAEGVSVLLADGEELRARYVIGADGAASTVARYAGIRRRKTMGVALEAEIPADGNLMRRFGSFALFIFGALRWGYLWVFPKRDYLSVGIGAMGKTRARLKAILLSEMQKLGIPMEGVPIRAHPLPIYTGRERLNTRRILLIGDAAGLMDPVLGEGIRYAVKSARIAAEAIIRGKVSSYTRRIWRTLGVHLGAARFWAWAFYNFPRAAFELGIRNPYLTPDFERMFNDRLDYLRMLLRIPLYLWGLRRRLPVQKPLVL